MDNLETIQQCLNDFKKAKEKEIGPELSELLSHIAKTGRTEFPWQLLKPLIACKLEKVLEEMFENSSTAENDFCSEPTSKCKDLYPEVKRLVNALNNFTGIPFTVQRLCELIIEPTRYYKTSEKFFRGVEKNIMVVSTVKPDGSLITRSSMMTNGSSSPVTTTMTTISTYVNPTTLHSISQDDITSSDVLTTCQQYNEDKNTTSGLSNHCLKEGKDCGMTEQSCDTVLNEEFPLSHEKLIINVVNDGDASINENVTTLNDEKTTDDERSLLKESNE